MVLKLETEEIMRINAARFKLIFFPGDTGDKSNKTKMKLNCGKYKIIIRSAQNQSTGSVLNQRVNQNTDQGTNKRQEDRWKKIRNEQEIQPNSAGWIK